MIKNLIVLLALSPLAANADIYASSVVNLNRGSVSGDFPGFYGGSFPGSFPVALTNSEAIDAVLGAPDNNFVSLPGVASTPGTGLQGAYIEVAFGQNFGANTLLSIWELGDNQESAQLFLWTTNGGNIQTQVTRGISDLISLDLSIYAATLESFGSGTLFSRVGIGGLDQNGSSQGFDLDAVSINPSAVPVPAAAWLFASGLFGFAGVRRRKA